MIWSIFIYISWIIVLLKISKTNSIIVIIGQNVAASKTATEEPVRIFFNFVYETLHLQWVRPTKFSRANHSSVGEVLYDRKTISLKNYETKPHVNENIVQWKEYY